MKADWRSTRLADVLQPIRRSETVQPAKTYDLIGIRLDGAGPFLRETKTGDQISAKQLFRVACGDFIYSRLFAWRGAFGTIGQRLDGRYVSGEFPTFVTNADRLDAEFLRLWFRLPSTLRTVESLCSGSTPLTRNRFKEQFFLDLEIPLPPLAEQQRIVARIDALAARIEEAKGLRAQAVAEVEVVMGGKLDEIYDDLATRYGLAPLDGACASITDGDHVTPRFSDGGTRFIFVGNVSSGYLHFNGCKYVDPAYYESLKEYRKPKRGDILYSAVGATLGVPAIVDADEAFCFQRHIAILKLDREIIDSTFMWYMLRSRKIHSHAWGQTTGSAQPTVPLRAIRAFPIVIPPISEQHQIAESLNDLQSKVDAVRRLQAETQAELDALLPAVLDRAFRGSCSM